MSWKLIEVPDDDETTLTDSELVGIGFALRDNAQKLYLTEDMFWATYSKIEDAVNRAARKWNLGDDSPEDEP